MPTRALLDEKILPLHRLVRTEDPEEMRAFLGEVFDVTQFRIRRDGGPFKAQVNRGQLDRITLLYFGYDADVRVEFPMISEFRQVYCLNGSAEIGFDGVRIPLGPNESCVAPPGTLACHYSPGCRQLMLLVPPDALHAKLRALLGASPGRPVEFDRKAELRTSQQQFLQKLVLFYAMELDSLQFGSSSPLKEHLEQSLLIALLCGNKNNYSFLLDSNPSDGVPKPIWLVETYIESNWNKRFTIEDITKLTGVNARSIFHAFKTYRGYSPMAFAKETRLKKARDLLARRASGLSVAQAAFACGFESHGHFSREYKNRFGESPSETLARS